MRSSSTHLLLSIAVMVCFSTFASPQQAARIQSIKLLTSDTGWAATESHLFWTTTAGREWKDITPQRKERGLIASVCFLNVSDGWVLLAYGREDSKTGIGDTFFDLASTTDSGAHWSVRRLDVPDPDPSRGLSGNAWLDFVDPRHGWVLVRMNGNTAVSMGVLRATEDGGETWKSLSVPAAGPIRFTTPTYGWLEGGPTEDVIQGITLPRTAGRIGRS